MSISLLESWRSKSWMDWIDPETARVVRIISGWKFLRSYLNFHPRTTGCTLKCCRRYRARIAFSKMEISCIFLNIGPWTMLSIQSHCFLKCRKIIVLVNGIFLKVAYPVFAVSTEIPELHLYARRTYVSECWDSKCSTAINYFLLCVVGERQLWLSLLQKAKEITIVKFVWSYHWKIFSHRVSRSPHWRVGAQYTFSSTRISGIENLDRAILTRRSQLILLKRTPIQAINLTT